jgi:hypothetical protein
MFGKKTKSTVKFRSFDVADEEKIQEFLAKHAEGLIGSKGGEPLIAYEAGKVCFLYHDPTQGKSEEEIEKDRLLAIIRESKLEMTKEAVRAEMEEKVWRGKILRSDPQKYPEMSKNIDIFYNQKMDFLAQVNILKTIEQQIKDGKWPGKE